MVNKIAVVTGATSKIMELVINKLVIHDFQIIAISRKPQPKSENNKIQWVTCDLWLPDSDFSFLKNADILFHTAAISNYYNREEYLTNNYGSTVHIVKAASDYGVEKIVYISSILSGYEYGDYGLSKIKSEEFITQNFNNWLIIRPSQVYGLSGKNPIDQLIENIRKNRFIVCPIGDEEGISPVYVLDIADKIIEYSMAENLSGTIQCISGPKSYSYKSLITEIARCLKKKVFIVPVPKFLVLAVYWIIVLLKLKIGIYPDKLYRFYHGNSSINENPTDQMPLSDYLSNIALFH